MENTAISYAQGISISSAPPGAFAKSTAGKL
jgi:hypothetical protein